MKSIALSSAAALAILGAAVGLQGCGGGSSDTQVNTQTTGQELVDLKNAHDQGIISDSEYEKKKKEIMKK